MKCPLCSESQNVARVSALYVAGIEAKHPRTGLPSENPDGRAPTPLPAWVQELSPQALASLGQRLAPPSGSKKQSFRPIHPDMILVAFSLLLPLFLYRIWATQTSQLPLVALILVVFYGFYFWQRRRLVARFQNLVDTRQADETRLHQAIGVWMRLYYCAADDVVFDPGRGNYADVEMLKGYLLE